jgi:hypothetical protein
MVLELIQNTNSDCDFVSSINESSFIEKTKNIKIKEEYYNFLFCILNNYDLILSSSPEKDKWTIFKKRLLEISSRIDEDAGNFYDNMNYNTKTMKKKLIQLNLHGSMEKEKNISSLYYMNDLFKIHLVFVDINKREYYETTEKNYNKVYLCLNRNKFYLTDDLPDNIVKKNITDSVFNIDVKKVYKTFLEPISKYKINDLRDIASGLNIPLKENNKNKTKNVLYDEINRVKLMG